MSLFKKLIRAKSFALVFLAAFNSPVTEAIIKNANHSSDLINIKIINH